MSSGFGLFGSGPSGYVNYKVFKESKKGGGGRKPSQNGGCLTSVLYLLAAAFLIYAAIVY